MFTTTESNLPGCLELMPKRQTDIRGAFVKVFHYEAYRELGLRCDFKEEYYSYSIPGVIRGIHFQTPPHDHTKIVYCASGRVLDVVVDLRVGSPTFKKSALFELSPQRASMLYIPPGFGHGFYTIEPSLMQYKVTSVYASEHDTGIRWDSLDVFWPQKDVIVSERDKSFPSLDDFESPFKYGGYNI